MAAYARDVILTGNGREAAKIKGVLGDNAEVDRAESRLQLLKRVPANTLSCDVAGLIPQQHIAQIFQVIQTSRPLVASAQQANLERGTISYPRIDTGPGRRGADDPEDGGRQPGHGRAMQTATATTYLGGGDLSWQAINWSTPNALDLWFRLAAADYALKTEQDAAQVLQHSAFSNNIGEPDRGDTDVRAVHDRHRCRVCGSVRELRPVGGHDLHGPGPVRLPARLDLRRVHAVRVVSARPVSARSRWSSRAAWTPA